MKGLAWFLSFAVGFLSLSQEVVWIRIVGFAFEGLPQAFSFVLGMFLGGIAIGALIGKRLCDRGENLGLLAGWCLIVAGFIDLSLVFLVPRLIHSPFPLLALALMIATTAGAKAIIFPIVHQLGSVVGNKLGQTVSRVYFMNILGSTLAPLLTGLVFLEYLSAGGMLVLIASGTLSLGALSLGFARKTSSRLIPALGSGFAAVLGIVVLLHLNVKDSSLVRSILQVETANLRQVIENRHGIIHVVAGKDDDDIVYGGNLYDGRTNIDLRVNSNRIDRAYLLHGLHPEPSRVLVIGLAAGAWTRVLTLNSRVQSVDVVEINPGYVKVIREYPWLAPILEDKRLNLHVDDGRRWIRRHAGNRYDLIVMNASFHWRANSTNLLSQEMFQMVRERLAPGGIFTFNATGSNDAFFTASQVFSHAYRYRNFVYASDHDFRRELGNVERRLLELVIDGVPVFDGAKAEDMGAIASLLAVPIEEVGDAIAASGRPLHVVTDQNMITEFRFGRRLF